MLQEHCPEFQAIFGGYRLRESRRPLWNLSVASEVLRFDFSSDESSAPAAFCDFAASPSLGGPLLWVGFGSPQADFLVAEDYPRAQAIDREAYNTLKERQTPWAEGVFLPFPRLQRENQERYEAAFGLLQPFHPFPTFEFARLRYRLESTNQTKPHPHRHEPVCFDPRRQEDASWCAPATVQMMLDFFRYNQFQDEIARSLGLKAGQGLDPGEDFKVVETVADLSRGAIAARMNACRERFGDWIVLAIQRNNPLILFNTGHAVAVMGSTRIRLLSRTVVLGMWLWDPATADIDQKPSWLSCGGIDQRVLFETKLR